MNSTFFKVAILSTVVAVSGCGKSDDQDKRENAPPQPAASASLMNETTRTSEHNAQGTVSAIDKENNQVVVALDPVPELNWPADTKAFKVEDQDTLDKLQQGDRVEFSFKEIGGGQYLAQDMSEE